MIRFWMAEIVYYDEHAARGRVAEVAWNFTRTSGRYGPDTIGKPKCPSPRVQILMVISKSFDHPLELGDVLCMEEWARSKPFRIESQKVFARGR